MEGGAAQARGPAGAGAAGRGRGHRQIQPGWHLALDLRNMPLVSECVARAALERTGPAAATPGRTTGRWTGTGAGSICCANSGTPRAGWRPRIRCAVRSACAGRPPSPSAPDLLALFEKEELVKYLAEEELFE
ncbi:hypothetical protein [Streptomyces sp. KL116D]|uniref:hypothetical protein n=1 Tax=Streptomyces sp. KL116D TaxID=3045152 RepID=UPI0035568244